MDQLSHLPKITKTGNKRVGRGIGSGKGGHTSGRGQKGQKARNKLPIYFMGSAAGAGFIKRLPYLRGKGKFKSHSGKRYPVNVELLTVLPKDTTVTVESLIAAKLVPETTKQSGVKILGGGTMTVALTVAVPVSQGARNKIEKAGGVIVDGEKTSRVISSVKTAISSPKKLKKQSDQLKQRPRVKKV